MTTVSVADLLGFSAHGIAVHQVEIPGANSFVGNAVFSVDRLPTEPIGVFTLRLTNIVVGSRYRVGVLVGNALATPTIAAEGVAAATTVDVTLDLYAAGNASNDLVIDVRKGTTAPKYKPFRTQATAQAGVVTAYIAQEPDLIA